MKSLDFLLRILVKSDKGKNYDILTHRMMSSSSYSLRQQHSHKGRRLFFVLRRLGAALDGDDDNDDNGDCLLCFVCRS